MWETHSYDTTCLTLWGRGVTGQQAAPSWLFGPLEYSKAWWGPCKRQHQPWKRHSGVNQPIVLFGGHQVLPVRKRINTFSTTQTSFLCPHWLALAAFYLFSLYCKQSEIQLYTSFFQQKSTICIWQDLKRLKPQNLAKVFLSLSPFPTNFQWWISHVALPVSGICSTDNKGHW